MKRWECIVCGFIYDEAEGWPEDGIPPGTRWEDVPDDWQCPDCGQPYWKGSHWDNMAAIVRRLRDTTRTE